MRRAWQAKLLTLFCSPCTVAVVSLACGRSTLASCCMLVLGMVRREENDRRQLRTLFMPAMPSLAKIENNICLIFNNNTQHHPYSCGLNHMDLCFILFSKMYFSSIGGINAVSSTPYSFCRLFAADYRNFAATVSGFVNVLFLGVLVFCRRRCRCCHGRPW